MSFFIQLEHHALHRDFVALLQWLLGKLQRRGQIVSEIIPGTVQHCEAQFPMWLNVASAMALLQIRYKILNFYGCLF